MDIRVSCRTIARLSGIGRHLPSDETRRWLQSVFLERRGGHAWAGATNSLFAAVEFLGKSDGDDGFIILRHDPALIDGDCVISDTPIISWCSVTVPGVYMSSEDAAFRDREAVETLGAWRTWFPDKMATAAGRPMFVDVDAMTALAASSPSRRVVFPRYIDADKPVIVRDVAQSDWIGVFLARPSNGIFLDGATIPEWVKS